MPVILISGFVFLTGVGLIIAANMLFYMILGEVNSRMEESERISPFFVNIRAPLVLKRHRMLYPASKARRHMALLFFIGLILFFGAFFGAVLAAMVRESANAG